MLFSSIPFAIFFIVLMILIKLLRGITIKKYILLLASLFFYAYWDIRFVPLLFFLASFNYYVSHKFNKCKNQSTRKYLLAFAIGVNLLVLGIFKYTNFFIDNLNKLSFNNIQLSALNIILPIGISFFIFEFISYLIDVYKDEIKYANNFLDFLLFSFFFPRLASGPIIRPSQFLPQLNNEIMINKRNLHDGIQIFVMGLFKKLVIADNLGMCADTVFKSPHIFNTPTIWIGVVSYTIQIYCDFSGYSDMAIGVAKMLGFELPINFNMPYISKNITEFWARWHISLSCWLKDYLYIPLGGNRKGDIRKNLNLLLTMLLGGLWHGASWNFVVWGGLHGSALVVQKSFSKQMQKHNIKINKYISKTLAWLFTMLFVCVTWVFFRAKSFDSAFLIIQKMFIPQSGTMWFYTLLIPISFILIIATIIKNSSKLKYYLILNLKKPVWMLFFIIVIFIIFSFYATNPSPFIYFQF